MLEQKFRNYYQQILVDPCAKLCGNRISPCQITYLAGITGVLVIPVLYWHASILACILILISGFLDTLDGTLARVNNSMSDYGSALDITMDRVVEWAIILGMLLYSPDRGIYVVLMLGSSFFCVTTFLVVGIFTPNNSHKSFHYSSGFMERAEAFVFFLIMILLPQTFAIMAILYTILVTLTGVIRMQQFKKFSEQE